MFWLRVLIFVSAGTISESQGPGRTKPNTFCGVTVTPKQFPWYYVHPPRVCTSGLYEANTCARIALKYFKRTRRSSVSSVFHLQFND